MSMSTGGVWIFGVAALVLLQCGGQAVSTEPAPSATDASGSGPIGGGSATADTCAGGASEDGGCNQGGDDSGLEPYARLRTACSLNASVNRRGRPVSIDCHIR